MRKYYNMDAAPDDNHSKVKKSLAFYQGSVLVTEEIFGEVFETTVFKDFLREQEMTLWCCNKADPESKGSIENTMRYVKSSYFSARTLNSMNQVQHTLPAWDAARLSTIR